MKSSVMVLAVLFTLVNINYVWGQTAVNLQGSDVTTNNNLGNRVCVNGKYTAAQSSSYYSTPEKCTSSLLVESTGMAAVYGLKNNEVLNQINATLINLATSVNANTESFKGMQAEIKKQNEEFNAKIQKSIVNRFDALPTTILSQIRTNAEFRQEVIKLLLSDESFQAELTQIKKEIVEEIKGGIASASANTRQF